MTLRNARASLKNAAASLITAKASLIAGNDLVSRTMTLNRGILRAIEVRINTLNGYIQYDYARDVAEIKRMFSIRRDVIEDLVR